MTMNKGQGTASVSLDSLPYIDYHDSDYEAYALSLIEHEMNTMSSSGEDSSVRIGIMESSPSLALTMKSEHEMLGNAPLFKARYLEISAWKKQEMMGNDMSSSGVLLPVLHKRKRTFAFDDGGEEELNAAKVLFEEERGRLMNLDIQNALDGDAWKYYNETLLEKDVSSMKKVLDNQRIAVDRINAKRKELQEREVPYFKVLNNKWEGLVDKKFRLQNAVIGLDVEVKRLRSERPDLMAAVDGSNEVNTTT